jgi:hypothetical protein
MIELAEARLSRRGRVHTAHPDPEPANIFSARKGPVGCGAIPASGSFAIGQERIGPKRSYARPARNVDAEESRMHAGLPQIRWRARRARPSQPFAYSCASASPIGRHRTIRKSPSLGLRQKARLRVDAGPEVARSVPHSIAPGTE